MRQYAYALPIYVGYNIVVTCNSDDDRREHDSCSECVSSPHVTAMSIGSSSTDIVSIELSPSIRSPHIHWMHTDQCTFPDYSASQYPLTLTIPAHTRLRRHPPILAVFSSGSHNLVSFLFVSKRQRSCHRYRPSSPRSLSLHRRRDPAVDAREMPLRPSIIGRLGVRVSLRRTTTS